MSLDHKVEVTFLLLSKDK